MESRWICVSLIACTDPCVYQKDGRCSLSRALSSGIPSSGGCVNFIPINPYAALQQRGQGLPDIGHPDQLQALRDHQLSLDPLGDQALGKAQTPDLGQPLSQGAD